MSKPNGIFEPFNVGTRNVREEISSRAKAIRDEATKIADLKGADRTQLSPQVRSYRDLLYGDGSATNRDGNKEYQAIEAAIQQIQTTLAREDNGLTRSSERALVARQAELQARKEAIEQASAQATASVAVRNELADVKDLATAEATDYQTVTGTLAAKIKLAEDTNAILRDAVKEGGDPFGIIDAAKDRNASQAQKDAAQIVRSAMTADGGFRGPLRARIESAEAAILADKSRLSELTTEHSAQWQSTPEQRVGRGSNQRVVSEAIPSVTEKTVDGLIKEADSALAEYNQQIVRTGQESKPTVKTTNDLIKDGEETARRQAAIQSGSVVTPRTRTAAAITPDINDRAEKHVASISASLPSVDLSAVISSAQSWINHFTSTTTPATDNSANIPKQKSGGDLPPM